MRPRLCYLEVTAGCTHHRCKFCTHYADLALAVQNVADGGYRGGPERGAEEVLLFLRQKSNPDFSDRGTSFRTEIQQISGECRTGTQVFPGDGNNRKLCESDGYYSENR